MWDSSILKKCLKFDLGFRNAKTHWGKTFCFLYNCIWLGCGNFSLLRRVLLFCSHCVNKQSQDCRYQSERHFPTQFISEWWNNLIKVLSCRFQKCLGVLNMLPLEGCSKTERFRKLSYHVFRSLSFQKYISFEAHVFFQNA